MNYWTCFWDVKEWEKWKREIQYAKSGRVPITHVASAKFTPDDQMPGDIIYIVTNIKGNLYLGGRLTVKEFTESKQTVAIRVGISEDDVYTKDRTEKERYLIGDLQKPDYFRNIFVPKIDVDKLDLERKNGKSGPPKEARERGIERNALRTPMRIVSGSEKVLDDALGGTF